jgi:hypothetical protein
MNRTSIDTAMLRDSNVKQIATHMKDERENMNTSVRPNYYTTPSFGCPDVMDHIKTCPVCQKLYGDTGKNNGRVILYVGISILIIGIILFVLKMKI